jgi:hypothetical protein
MKYYNAAAMMTGISLDDAKHVNEVVYESCQISQILMRDND